MEQIQYPSLEEFNNSDHRGFFPCRGACYELNRIQGYHVSCQRILTPEPINRLTKILGYGFEPSPAAEKRRCHWLTNQLVPALEASVRLPPVVRANVAQYLLPEYAAARNAQFSHLSDTVTSVKVSIPIKISYATFEGATYVDDLTNKTEVANDWVPPKVLYIASDHRGIRKLIFSSSDDSPKADSVPDLWWQTLPLLGQNGTLKCHRAV